MEIATSAAAIDDIPLLADLWKAMVEHHRQLVGREWPVRASQRAWEIRREQYRDWLEQGSGFIFLAHTPRTAEPAGYAACRLVSSGPTFDLGETYGDIDSLVTDPAARGLGVGTALLNSCREELARRGIEYWSIGVVEANSRAVALYERLGFRPFTRNMLASVAPTSS